VTAAQVAQTLRKVAAAGRAALEVLEAGADALDRLPLLQERTRANAEDRGGAA
jgi:hypothetical protein